MEETKKCTRECHNRGVSQAKSAGGLYIAKSTARVRRGGNTTVNIEKRNRQETVELVRRVLPRYARYFGTYTMRIKIPANRILL